MIGERIFPELNDYTVTVTTAPQSSANAYFPCISRSSAAFRCYDRRAHIIRTRQLPLRSKRTANLVQYRFRHHALPNTAATQRLHRDIHFAQQRPHSLQTLLRHCHRLWSGQCLFKILAFRIAERKHSLAAPQCCIAITPPFCLQRLCSVAFAKQPRSSCTVAFVKTGL